MNRKHTMSGLARAVGVPRTTLRYYERIGLLQPENRSAGNYRLYTDESVQRLRFIRAAQAIGFTLDDVRALLGDSGSVPCCGDVQQLIEDRLAEINQRMKDLRQVQRVLAVSLSTCHTSNPRQACHVLDSLTK